MQIRTLYFPLVVYCLFVITFCSKKYRSRLCDRAGFHFRVIDKLLFNMLCNNFG